MLQAAHAAELLPHRLSFTAALQTIAASWLTTLFLDEKVKAALFRANHIGIASYRIGNRPDRVEPRASSAAPNRTTGYPNHEASHAQNFSRPVARPKLNAYGRKCNSLLTPFPAVAEEGDAIYWLLSQRRMRPQTTR